MLRIWLASAALVIWPALAAAESYDVLGWNETRLAAVDRESVTDAGGLKRVRITVIYAQPRSDALRPYRGMIGLQEFDCAQGRYHTLESAPFDDEGAPISALASKEPTAWQSIAPGTLGADERQRVCDGAWSRTAYRTKLTALLAAYSLRPDPPPARAPVQAASATVTATDASAITPAP
jgi:hypothetical protein